MPSPAKKRKLNDGPKSSSSGSLPSRGLEYFFAKQRQGGAAAVGANAQSHGGDGGDGAVVHEPLTDQELTDEELARKLQAEWDREDAEARQGRAASGTPSLAKSPTPFVDDKYDVGTRSPQKTMSTETTAKGKGTLSLQSAAASADTLTESIPLDESPLTFDPAKYLPQLKQHWADEGGSATYALLTRCFVLVSGTTSRIKIVDTMVNCLRILIEGDPDSLLPAVSYLPSRLLTSLMISRPTKPRTRYGYRRTPSRRRTSRWS